LGQFIDARPTQEFSYTCHTTIVPAWWFGDWSILENRHRPEPENRKFLSVEAASPLSDQDWTGAIKFNGDSGNHKKRPKKHYCRHGSNDVQSPFHCFLKIGQRHSLDSDWSQQRVRGHTTLRPVARVVEIWLA
jgi:hypothetical protein